MSDPTWAPLGLEEEPRGPEPRYKHLKSVSSHKNPLRCLEAPIETLMNAQKRNEKWLRHVKQYSLTSKGVFSRNEAA